MTARSARPTLREWLAREPFALGMSAGFFGFFAHAGVASVLEEEGLLPTRAAGASAGALVVGLWASGVDAPEIRDLLLQLRRRDFWDPAPGPGLLRGRRFRRLLARYVQCETFADCRFQVAFSAFDLLARQTRVLDHGPLVPALHASCAFPFLFQPVWLDWRPHSDGGIADRHGLAGIPAGTRLFYHHLGSRSPWRGPGSPVLKVPARPGTVALVVDGLPRVSPLHLHRGPAAMHQARQATRRALDLPVEEQVVERTACVLWR